jgi:hypothetical protein
VRYLFHTLVSKRACILFLTSMVLLLACDSTDLNTLDTGASDTIAALDTASTADTAPATDTALLSDTAPIEDTMEPPDTVPPPDTTPAVDTHEEEDLSGIDVTWTKDIKSIADTKCGNCHGAAGSHGLKLYTRKQWELYYTMIVPAIEKGMMPQGTSMAPGQLDLIKLWAKVGFPE